MTTSHTKLARSIATTLRTPDDLANAGLIPADSANALGSVAERYAIAVPPLLGNLITDDLVHDPIARQVIPTLSELETTDAERADPIGDHVKSPIKGLVHRYPDRVLLKVVGVCPVYCRFCFRREMVGPAAEANLTRDEIDAALGYVAAHPEIWEVIVTGGDPFMLSADRARALTEQIDAIDHVKVVRWHTRAPVAAPDLITDDFADALACSDRQVIVAVHINHLRELSPDARATLTRLRDRGVMLVSQTVLLRGVNADVETLDELMRGLVEAGVKPYYLHHPDLAPGTGHFRLTLSEGQALYAALRQRLSGIALPTYVLDVPDGYGKVPAGRAYVGDAYVSDPAGRRHDYSG